MTEAAGPMPRTPSAPTLDRVSEEVRELSEDQTGADAGTQDAVLLFVGGPLDGRVEIREARHGEPLPTVTHVHLHGGPKVVHRYDLQQLTASAAVYHVRPRVRQVARDESVAD